MGPGPSTTRALHRLGALLGGVALVVVACGDDAEDVGEAAATGGSEVADEIVYPGDEWSYADPGEMGFDPDTLEELAGVAEDNDSDCVVVTRDGQIVAEWYWGDTEPDTQNEAWSVTKSYTSSLVGLALEDTDLELDDKASNYITEWAGTDSEDVTIRNLLSNDSGRSWAETHSMGIYVDIVAAEDRNELAVDLGQDGPPGETWEYNDGAIQTLDVVLSEVTGTAPADYAEEQLFEPIGASNTDMSTDGAGNTSMFFEVKTTCQDLARYGYLYLNDGVWDGEQVLPEGWVEQATGQPSQELSANYGYLWWLNRSGDADGRGGGEGGDAEDVDDVEGADQDVPRAPEDMYWARGLGGQIIQVDPGSNTVVTRMGGGDDVFGATYRSDETAAFVTEALVD